MVFQKRYGFKFLPLDGENTTFSYTRGVALGGSILLAFLFAGLGVPVVEYVIIFGVTVFLVSLIGEKWSRLGFALTISLAIGFLSLLVHFQFAGIGRHQGIGLLYGYAGAVFALSISDYLRSKQSTQNRAAFLCLCAAFALLLFLDFPAGQKCGYYARPPIMLGEGGVPLARGALSGLFILARKERGILYKSNDEQQVPQPTKSYVSWIGGRPVFLWKSQRVFI